MKLIDISDTYNQTFTTIVANQSCSINLYQKSTGFYFDLFLNNTLLVGGVLCENYNPLVRDAYFGFIGDFMFWDTHGISDPSSPGLGTRYQFWYIEASDLSQAFFQ